MNTPEAPASPATKIVYNNLNGDGKRALYVYLLKNNGQNQRLRAGLIQEAASHFKVSESTVKRTWKFAKAFSPSSPHRLMKCLSPQKKGKVGRKKRILPLDEIRALPPSKRRTVRILAKNIGIPKSTIQDNIQRKYLIRHTNSVKPAHTEKNLLQRLQHCVSQIVPETIATNPIFKDMSHVVHLDEKWFNLMEITEKCIMVPGEKPKKRSCKSKRYIGKLMFLSAVGRPRFHPETRALLFNGKYGIWPFIQLVPAARGSRYRPAGTIEIKSVEVDRDTYRNQLIDYFVPSFVTKHPNLEERIIVQQDNAKPHIFPDDDTFVYACEEQGLALTLTNQPPNSPDFNVNDLGLFRALDKRRQEVESNNLAELIENVKKAYADFPPEDLNKIWLSYQQCMLESMKAGGTNAYKLPHMGKNKLLRQGNLPTSLNIPLEIVQSTLALIAEKQAALENI